MLNPQASQPPDNFQLHYLPLTGGGEGYTFPCDSKGCVELDRLSERERNNYLFARAVVGRDLATPAVEPACTH